MTAFWHFILGAIFICSYKMDTVDGANLTRITWAHAVNNQALLKAALTGDVERLEADISIGQLNGQGPDIPIMAHPPAKSSDLSLAQFLQAVKTHNDNNTQTPKGIKLDFKSLEAINSSVQIITPHKNVSYPFWLNADILKGPGNPGSVPVDPVGFLQLTKSFSNSILSLGWTTVAPDRFSYTVPNIADMVAVVKDVQQEITFPMRAGILAETSKEVLGPLKQIKRSTLTVWSSEGDKVDVKKLEEVIFDWGVDRVYIDVPKDLYQRLHLGSGATSMALSVMSALFAFVFVVGVNL